MNQYNKMKSDLDELNKQANQIRKMPGLTAKQRADRLQPIKELQLLYKRTIAAQVELGLESGD